MAVTVREDGMSADSNNNKKDSSHEYNLHLDRQLQNKLLQADEVLDQDQNYVKLGNNFTGSNNCNGKINKTIEFHDGISGWISDQKVVPRKVDKESKPTNKDNFIYPWRDSKRQQENFVFQHYADIRKYIEQYRSLNCCHISSSPYPPGETRKLAFQHSAPPQPSPYQQSVWNGHTTPPASTPNSYQYARRENSLTANLSTNVTPCSCIRCSKTGNYQKPGSASQAHRYRLTSVYNPVSNTQSDSRSDIQSDSEKGERCQTPRINSGIHSFGRTAGRAPGKSASSNFKPYPLQALTM
ncbi:hypothetical protein ACJMK2_039992 [Sinanodonta woodiana]|uniref:Uncharacterized protein n=1 Tax=Sinanodonta woodiana TaxID=1069815 RepID=A0ABD3WF55_SINWO